MTREEEALRAFLNSLATMIRDEVTDVEGSRLIRDTVNRYESYMTRELGKLRLIIRGYWWIVAGSFFLGVSLSVTVIQLIAAWHKSP